MLTYYFPLYSFDRLLYQSSTLLSMYSTDMNNTSCNYCIVDKFSNNRHSLIHNFEPNENSMISNRQNSKREGIPSLNFYMQSFLTISSNLGNVNDLNDTITMMSYNYVPMNFNLAKSFKYS